MNNLANDELMARDETVSRQPVALIDAARSEQSRIIADLLMTAGRAIARLVKSIPWTTDMEAHRFRKAVGELEALSDRMLADIGVERRMIPEVVREIMAAEKQKVAVVKPDTQASSKRKTVPLAANCNEIEKHHHAA